MSQLFVYARSMASCASTANTAFILLQGGSPLSYVETGVRQTGGEPGKWALFGSYRDYSSKCRP